MVTTYLDTFFSNLEQKNPGQPEYIQAVREVLGDVSDYVLDRPDF